MGIKAKPICNMKKICTKNKLIGYCIGVGFIITGILIFIVFVISNSVIADLHLNIFLIISAVLCAYPGLLLIYISHRKNSFYINIFEEYVMGKALVNGKKTTFYLAHRSIIDIRTIPKKSIFIDTLHSTYEIPVPPEYFFAMLSEAGR